MIVSGVVGSNDLVSSCATSEDIVSVGVVRMT